MPCLGPARRLTQHPERRGHGDSLQHGHRDVAQGNEQLRAVLEEHLRRTRLQPVPPTSRRAGLSEKAQASIKSLRMLSDQISPWDCEPAGGLLSDRQENEAYCLANAGVAYAVFFTDGGQVDLDVSAVGGGELSLAWLDISRGKWSSLKSVAAPAGRLELPAPGAGLWAALVKPSK